MNQFKIIIQFSIPTNARWFLLSTIIRWSEFRKSLKPFIFFRRYHSSHVSILVDDVVTEAVLGLGVRQITKKSWDKINKVNLYKTIVVDEDKYHEVKMFLAGSVGVPYSGAEALGIFIQRIFKTLFKKDIENPFKSIKRKVKCSQLVFEVLKITKSIIGLRDSSSVGVRDIEVLLP
jgi:hypothetical protein